MRRKLLSMTGLSFMAAAAPWLCGIEGNGDDGGAGGGGNPPPADGGKTPPADGGNPPPADGSKAPPVPFASLSEPDRAVLKELGFDDPAKALEALKDHAGRAKDLPAKPEDFDFAPPSDMPEDLPYDAALADAFRKIGVDEKLTKSQAKALHDFWVADQVARHRDYVKGLEEAKDKAWQELRRIDPRWRGDGGKQLVDRVQAFVRGKGPPGLADELVLTHEGNKPLLIAFFEELSRDYAEDDFVSGQPGGASDRSLAEEMYPTMQKKS